MDSELSFVIKLKAKDLKALSALYDQYHKALFGVMLKIVRSTELAEDLLQEVFMKIWFSIDTYDPDRGRLFTWMLNLARNLAIDTIR